MRIEPARVEEVRFLIPKGFESVEATIEHYARICYRSEAKTKDGSDEKLVKRLMKRGHHAMLEFCDAAVIFSCDRGMSHELVRHRLASFAQESTRYCDYHNDRFGGGITVIEQPTIKANDKAQEVWEKAMEHADSFYQQLRELGIPAQNARSVLPIGLRTKIAMKANIREWMHTLSLRCSEAAHEIIRSCALTVLVNLYAESPILFGDLHEKYLSQNAS